MTLHVMLDIETTDTANTTAVLSIGAVKFNPYNKNEEPYSPLYIRPEVDEQFSKGRTVSESTLDWWSQQTEAEREEAFGSDGRISVHSMLDCINRYLVGVDKIWANGPVFDIGILEHLYRQYNRPVPWQYWQICDARTVFDMGDDSAKKNNTSAHNALADAFCQAQAVQNIYYELNVKEKK